MRPQMGLAVTISRCSGAMLLAVSTAFSMVSVTRMVRNYQGLRNDMVSGNTFRKPSTSSDTFLASSMLVVTNMALASSIMLGLA